MTDDETRQQLFAFFGWPPREINKLNVHELAAWRKHFEALRNLSISSHRRGPDDPP